MTVERFQEDAVTAWRDQLVKMIRDISVARRLYPVNQAVTAADSMYTYYKIHEQSNIQYGFEIQASDLNEYATEKVSTAVPILQGDMVITRHERARAAKDVLPLDARVREMVDDLNAEEEKTAIYGDAAAGTVLHDTTNVSTAATDELDLGTFVEGVQHFHTSLSQLRNLLKNKFQGAKLKLVWTSDVDDRARAINSTTNDAYTFFDYATEYLNRFNGTTGEENIFVSNYLGSATNAGTTNMAMVASDPRNMELISSELEVTQGADPHDNLAIQLGLRSKPIFYRDNDSVIYHGTVVLTA